MRKQVLFYASVKKIKQFYEANYFTDDIRALEELGNTVVLSNKITDAFKFWKYDFVFAYFYRYSLLVAIIARLFFKKVYFTGGIDALDRTYAGEKKYTIQKYLFWGCYLLSTRCNIVSSSDMEHVKEIIGKKDGKLSFAEHSIEIGGYDPNCKKEKLFTTIVWQGTKGNVIRKGVDIALYVFSKLKMIDRFHDYQFAIMGGSGEGTPYIQELCEKYGILDSVIITGYISEEEKKAMLSKSEYYVQLSRYEGFGVSILEAICAKSIVILSGKGGLNNPDYNGTIMFNIDSDWDKEIEALIEIIGSYEPNTLNRLKALVEAKYNFNCRKDNLGKMISLS